MRLGRSLLIMLLPTVVWAQGGRVDVNEAYRLAVLRSEALQISEQEIRAAEARYWQAVSAVLPQVSVYASQEVGSRRVDGRKDRFSAGLSGAWTVFDGFRQYNLAGAEAAMKRGLTADLARARQLLFMDVSDVFLQIAGLEADLLILQDLAASLRQRKKELDDRIAIGLSRKSELLSTATDIAANEAEMAAVKGLLGASRELMAFLTGVPSERFALAPPPGDLPVAGELFAYLFRAGARPDLRAAAEYETAARRVVSADKGSFWPTVSVGAGWAAVEAPAAGHDWSVTVSAALPIFDSGYRAAKLTESSANLRATELNLTRVRRMADYEVRLAYNNFISAADRYLQLNPAVLTANENYEAQKQDYELGRSSNLDVLTALTDWQRLRRQLLAAEIQARANLVHLEVAAGEPATDGKAAR